MNQVYAGDRSRIVVWPQQPLPSKAEQGGQLFKGRISVVFPQTRKSLV